MPQAPLAPHAAVETTPTELNAAAAIATHNQAARAALVERLMALEPYAFEHFVKELLEAMDYPLDPQGLAGSCPRAARRA